MIKLLLILFTCACLFSCCNKNEPLLIARNENNSDQLGVNTYFTLERNHTFSCTFIPVDSSLMQPTSIKGRFFIKEDTIYFTKNTHFKKAIIKNGELEVIGRYFKVKIIDNNTSIPSKKSNIDYEDFTLFAFSKGGYHGFDQGKNADLNQLEIKQLKRIIQQKMDLEKDRFNYHSKQSEYYKQCICITNRNNEKMVWVNCLSKKDKTNFSRWKSEIMRIHDGGEYYFELKINLTKKTIEEFYVHGNA